MNKIVSKEHFSANVVKLEVEAPLIARSRKAGHFVIVKVGEKGERIPLTIAGAALESGSGAVEERARMRLGMVRKDEVLFRFVPKGEKKDVEAGLMRDSSKSGKPNYFAPKRSNLYTEGVLPPKVEPSK